MVFIKYLRNDQIIIDFICLNWMPHHALYCLIWLKEKLKKKRKRAKKENQIKESDDRKRFRIFTFISSLLYEEPRSHRVI